MLKWLKSFFSGIWDGLNTTWTRWSEEGVRVPVAYSPAAGKPSVTLLLVHLSSWASIASLAFLHWRDDKWIPTAGVLIWWAMCMVFYLMRTLQKFKVDLDDKQIELESGSAPEPTDDAGQKEPRPDGE